MEHPMHQDPALQAVPRSRAARFNEILQILLRNDVWGLLRDLQAGPQGAAADAPTRMRRILEELGPTFIKLGQLLATRPDLVPARYVEEFKLLYDQTDPSPFEEVAAVIEADLGRPVGSLFQEFAPEAIASASIGQVHRATLRDGRQVAVKVQHIAIEESMHLDFDILRGLALFVEKTFSKTRVWQPVAHLDELRAMLERELDYRYEMKNTKRVAEHFRLDPTVHIPAMVDALCGRRVLVMEFVEGIKFTDVASPRLAGIDRRNVARIITHAMARQIFVHRLFHADPSPGNMLILGSDKIAFLDFGAVGIVTQRRAKAILRLITSINKGDVEATSEAVVDLCDQSGEHDSKRFTTDVEKVLDYFEREDVSVADPRLMEMLLNLAQSHRMRLPPDFVLISRALFQFEGFCRELDPDYELVTVLEPFVAEVLWKNMASPKKQKELAEETVGEMFRFLRSFPHTLNTIVRKIERNELSTRIEVAGLEGLKSAQGRSTLKVSFTILMGALLIGLGILYAGPTPEERVGPFLFGSGAIIAVWTLVMVLWSEAFKGNRE